MYISISSILGSRIFRNDSHQNSYRRHAPQQQHCSNNGNSGSDDCTRSSSIEQGWWAIFNFRIISRCCGKAMKILVSFHPSCRSHKWFVDFIPGSRQVIDRRLLAARKRGKSTMVESQATADDCNRRQLEGVWGWMMTFKKHSWTNM